MASLKRFFDKQNNYTIQYRSLHIMLLFGILLSSCAGLINIIFALSLPQILLPVAAAFFCFLLLIYAHIGAHPYWAKISFILFLDFIYFPLGWITSAGSKSSMPYYSILFLLSTFLLIEYYFEYIFPLLFMILAVFLMYAQVRWPSLVYNYNSATVNPLNNAFHYVVITVFIAVIFITLFQKYMDIENSSSRQYTKDELTGLYSRTYGLRALAKAYNKSIAEHKPYTLMLLGFDGLKKLNKSHGSAIGDLLIHDFANILLRNIRSDDVSARLNGNLFMVILTSTSPSQLDGLTSRLNKDYLRYASKNDTLSVKLLVGTAAFDYNSISEVMKVAQNQLDHFRNNKNGGSND